MTVVGARRVHRWAVPPRNTWVCLTHRAPGRDQLKSAEEIMQILEAFDLTRSFRDAGELAGCDHKTVAAWVARRDAGAMSAEPARRARLIDPFLPKLE